MKKINLRLIVLLISFITISVSCKSKKEDMNTTPATTSVDTTTPTPAPAPVVISSDDELKKGVTDATKDYPSVKADVADSVINLSGEIKRADWQKLMPTLSSLHPKRVNSSSLTIK